MSKCSCENKNKNIYRSTMGKEMLTNQGTFGGDLRNGLECDNSRMIPIIAPVVFDQVGINLCRYIPFPQEIMANYSDIASVMLEVVDIDLSDEGVCTKTIESNPYCVRIRLSDLLVTFSAKLLDCHGKYIDTVLFRALYLDSNPNNEYFHEESNPCHIILDLYAPYGPSFKNVDTNNSVEPVIEFIGFSTSNNHIPQGLVTQALAEVVDYNDSIGGMSVGLTLNIASIYYLQYKIPHVGVSVPPKAEIECREEKNSCQDFIEGGLLERKIKPLDLGTADLGEEADCNCKKYDYL